MIRPWIRRILLAPLFVFAVLFGGLMACALSGFVQGDFRGIMRDAFDAWWWGR
jgi:hypothetical protein